MTDSDVIILRHLLQSNGAFVSGNDLAGILKMSRVGVWARLEKLRGQGFKFEAVRHKGYRLLEEPTVLHDKLVRTYLDIAGCNASLFFESEVDSTNSEAERLLAAGTTAPYVVLTGKQSEGRGRLGRNWHSPEDGNCYMSFVFRPDLSPSLMQSFTLWMGLKFCACLEDQFQLPMTLKWPNDLVLNNRKVGGMLTEARIDADRTRDLVVGLGLNVNSDPATWPEAVRAVGTTLAEANGGIMPINRLAASLIEHGISAFHDYLAGKHEATMASLWERFDMLAGKTITAKPGRESLTGVADGIDADGSLLLRLESGEVVPLRAGEVSLGSAQMLGDG